MTVRRTYVTVEEFARLDAEQRAAEVAYYEANPDAPMPVFLSGRGMKADWSKRTIRRDPDWSPKTPEGDKA